MNAAEKGSIVDHIARSNAVIQAMHDRPWWRTGFLLRRPWRVSSKTAGSVWYRLRTWFNVTHDCSDPAIGCSCAGSYRFPWSQFTE